MKVAKTAMLIFALSLTAAQAQSMNKQGDAKQTSPGTTGAMGNVNANGVATDPGGVQQQQGRSAESSPGTVGAAPTADTPSQKPKN
jgi:hypothetical protein